MNIADAPSRGDCKSLHELGASETNVNVEMVWNDLQEFQMGEAKTSRVIPHGYKKSVRVVNVKSLSDKDQS